MWRIQREFNIYKGTEGRNMDCVGISMDSEFCFSKPVDLFKRGQSSCILKSY
jgi:hypothetical protein